MFGCLGVYVFRCSGVRGVGFRCSGFRVWGLGFRVWGLGFWGPKCTRAPARKKKRKKKKKKRKKRRKKKEKRKKNKGKKKEKKKEKKSSTKNRCQNRPFLGGGGGSDLRVACPGVRCEGRSVRSQRRPSGRGVPPRSSGSHTGFRRSPGQSVELRLMESGMWCPGSILWRTSWPQRHLNVRDLMFTVSPELIPTWVDWMFRLVGVLLGRAGGFDW